MRKQTTSTSSSRAQLKLLKATIREIGSDTLVAANGGCRIACFFEMTYSEPQNRGG